MRLATAKQLRNAVKDIADTSGNVWGRRTWTDRRRAKDASYNERYVVFKFGDAKEADRVAAHLETLFKLSGITAKVTRTSTNDDYYSRSSGGEYVRTIGTVG